VRAVGRRLPDAELDGTPKGRALGGDDVDLKRSSHNKRKVANIRSRLAMLPAAVNVGGDLAPPRHMLSGWLRRSHKIFSEDLTPCTALRATAGHMASPQGSWWTAG
jgi:HME family heavy-metal exporter